MPGRPPSPLWQHFEMPDGDFRRAVCNHCKAVVCRGKEDTPRNKCYNSSMAAHMKSAHSELMAEVREQQAALRPVERPPDPRDETVRGTLPLFKLRNQVDRAAWRKLIFPMGPSVATTAEQRKHDIDSCIMATNILDLQPINQVNRAGFQMLMATTDPTYTLCSDFYYRQLLMKIYVKGKVKIKQYVDNENPKFVSLSLDAWSAHKHGYMGAIANYITPDWRRQALVLGVKPYLDTHTSAHMAEWIVEILEEWELLRATEVIISDTAANMLGIFNRQLAPDLPSHFIPGKCVNHILQLAINDCILKKPNVARILRACRSICTHANISINFCIEFAKMQEERDPEATVLQLMQDVPTRWNSSFLMLQRFAKLKEVLLEMGSKEEHSDNLGKIRSCDWPVIANVVKMLQVFFEVTEQLSHSSACISEVVPCVTMLIRALERTGGSEDDGVRGLKDDLKAAVVNRLGGFEDEKFYLVSTLVDPRWKDAFFRQAESAGTAKSYLMEEVEREMAAGEDTAVARRESSSSEPDDTTSTSIIGQLRKRIRLEQQRQTIAEEENSVEKVVGDYLKLPQEEYRVLRFWKKFEEDAGEDLAKKALLQVVRRHLTLPPSSTNVERLFSYAGLATENHRASLAGERLDAMLFLRENVLMANFTLEW